MKILKSFNTLRKRKFLKSSNTLRKIVGIKSLLSFFGRASKKAIYLNQGRQGLDPSQIKAADILFKDIAIKYRDVPKSTEPINKTLFLFWWDGFDSAPEIVKLCVKSVIKNYPDYNIILLDKTNLKEYLPEDDIVFQAYMKGKTIIQNFTDYLRFYLMYNYGGYWIDSTLFFLKRFPLDEVIGDEDFGSIGFSTLSRCFYVDGIGTKWCDFFYGARKHAPICKAFLECFQRYYSKYNFPFDYFMMDCILFVFMKYFIENGVLDRIKTYPGSAIYVFQGVGINAEVDERKIYECEIMPQKLDRKIKLSKVKKGRLLDYLLSTIR